MIDPRALTDPDSTPGEHPLGQRIVAMARAAAAIHMARAAQEPAGTDWQGVTLDERRALLDSSVPGTGAATP